MKSMFPGFQFFQKISFIKKKGGKSAKTQSQNKIGQQSLRSMIYNRLTLKIQYYYCTVSMEIKYKIWTSFETLTPKKQQQNR